ncbi:MAG: type III-B CRISPR module-associated protein Cmr3 [Saprospiraceae bacterium]
MPNIIIQATDTLFFRDGRPFSMGDDSFAQGIFPPPPSVIYGALRTVYVAKGLEDGFSQSALVAESEELQVNYFSVHDGFVPYFPLPADLIIPKDENRNFHAFPLKLENAPRFSNGTLPQILESTKDGKVVDEPILMKRAVLLRYLKGIDSEFEVQKRSDFTTSEFKIGIGRDKNSNTADDGKLFRVQMTRPANDKMGLRLCFSIGFEGLDTDENGWLVLGGERRVAFSKPAELNEISMPAIDTPEFKIYLATPAFFSAGWKPENLLAKYKLELFAAAVDRPLSVGGWDLKEQTPKPMVQCVPAGSVFFVRAPTVEAAQNAAKEIHGCCISDNTAQTNFQKQGFGLAFVGKINQNQ